MDSPITVERSNQVAVVWLDRPKKLNALAPAFWREFPAVIGDLGADEQVRAIVIAGKGRAFTVGLDLGAFAPVLATGSMDPEADPPGTPVAQRKALQQLIKTMQRTPSSVADCPKPVIAAVHGHCIGGGVDLIAACDIRYAAAGTTFSVRETRLAMVADLGTLQRLPRIVDAGTVAELVYTGRDFDAGEAVSIGLVGKLFPDAETTVAGALETAALIARNSPLAVQGAKAVLRAAEGRTIGEALDYVSLWNAAYLQSNDLGEALTAFVEKRDPTFEGN
jgi:Delta3,5-Delta2,4-dienoyl-CoA isomerase